MEFISLQIIMINGGMETGITLYILLKISLMEPTLSMYTEPRVAVMVELKPDLQEEILTSKFYQ